MAKEAKKVEPFTPRWATCPGLEVPVLVAQVLGDGRFIRPGVTEIFGNPSSGKSALAYHIGGLFQKAGGLFYLVDWELAYDPVWAGTLGVDGDKLIYVPTCRDTQGMPEIFAAEDVYQSLAEDIAKVRQSKPDIPIWVLTDSLANLMPKERAEADMDEATMRTRISVASWAADSVPKLNVLATMKSISIVFINQVRDSMKPAINPFMDNKRTPGGWAFEHGATVRVKVKHKGKIRKGESTIGIHSEAENVKCKIGAPYSTFDFDLFYERGLVLPEV